MMLGGPCNGASPKDWERRTQHLKLISIEKVALKLLDSVHSGSGTEGIQTSNLHRAKAALSETSGANRSSRLCRSLVSLLTFSRPLSTQYDVVGAAPSRRIRVDPKVLRAGEFASVKNVLTLARL